MTSVLTWLNTDGNSLLKNLRRALQVSESLVGPYLTGSQVLELPHPSQEVFLVVILGVLERVSTGSFTLRFFSLAPLIKSALTFSKDFTF